MEHIFHPVHNFYPCTNLYILCGALRYRHILQFLRSVAFPRVVLAKILAINIMFRYRLRTLDSCHRIYPDRRGGLGQKTSPLTLFPEQRQINQGAIDQMHPPRPWVRGVLAYWDTTRNRGLLYSPSRELGFEVGIDILGPSKNKL